METGKIARDIGELDLAVARTLAFFDIFDYPLDRLQLWRFLPLTCSLSQLDVSLGHWRQSGHLAEEEGHFFLSGRQGLVSEKKRRYDYAQRKLKRARRVARLFRLFPGVRLVFLSNLIGQYNLRDGSDIDFFLVCRPGNVWLSRLWCAGLMKAMNLRPRQGDKRDKVCLSFYVSSRQENLYDLAQGEDDDYFHYWLLGLFLLAGEAKEYEGFLADNIWLRRRFPNYYSGIPARQPLPKAASAWVSFWEDRARALQFRLMAEPLKHAALAKQAIISDDVLKLFLHDKRSEFNNRGRQRAQEYFGL